MKRFLARFLTFLAIAWICTIVFLYFFDVRSSLEGCLESESCFAFPGTFLTVTWRTSHAYYLDPLRHLAGNDRFPGISPLLGIVVIMGLGYIFWLWYLKSRMSKSDTEVKVSAFFLWGVYAALFFLVAFQWFSFYDLLNKPALATGIFQHFFFQQGSVFLLFFPLAGFGRKLLKLLGFSVSETLPLFFLATSTGTGAFLFILFLLGLLGSLSFWPVLGFLVLIVLLSFRDIWFFIQAAAQRTIGIGKGVPRHLSALLLLFLFIVIAHNQLELIRPMPIGFDDLALYMNVPKLLAGNGSLLSGFDAYGWGLFMSLGFILFGSASMSMVIAFLGGLLAAMGLYLIILQYGRLRGTDSKNMHLPALLIAVLFYTLPTVVFQSAKDMKFDLAALFFCIAGLLVLLIAWHQERISFKDVLLAGLFIGTAFTIKYTALFFLVAVMILVVFSYIGKEKGYFQKAFLAGIFFIVAFSLPFLPFGIKNIVESRLDVLQFVHSVAVYISLSALQYITHIVTFTLFMGFFLCTKIFFPRFWKSTFAISTVFLILILGQIPLLRLPVPWTMSLSTSAAIVHADIQKIRSGALVAPTILINPQFTALPDSAAAVSEPSGVREELQRYIGYDEGWLLFLLLPFRATFNTTVVGMYVDAGYIWLALIPVLFLLVWFSSAATSERFLYFKLLTIAGTAYWLLWLFMAQGVIWYGFGGFVFLGIWLFELLQILRESTWKVVRYFAGTTLILWFFAALLLRTAFLPEHGVQIDRKGVEYARGILDENAYFSSKIAPYLPIIRQVNESMNDSKERNYVYRVGTFIKYFIAHNDRTVFDDNQLDTFTYLQQDGDDAKTYQRLKNAGFRYFIIDTNTPTIDKTPEQSLIRKYENLIRFLKNNPTYVKIVLDQPQFGVLFAEVL